MTDSNDFRPEAEEKAPFSEENKPAGLGDAVEAGSTDAKDAAKKFYGRVSSLFGRAAYGLSYYSAYGVSFAAALAKEAMPEKMKEGFADGAKAGDTAAKNTLNKVRDTFKGSEENMSDSRGAQDDVPGLPGTV